MTHPTTTFADLFAPTPRGRILGSARHHVLLTAAGTGFSNVGERALTRWRGDRLRDADGVFVYLRDADSGAVWSAGYGPTRAMPGRYEARWGVGTAEIEREDDGIVCVTTVGVAPGREGGAPAELRRVMLTNCSDRTRRIELTSYTEPVILPRLADLSHPAFAKLFIQTEQVEGGALLARRRPRGADDVPFYAVHTLAEEADAEGFETDRMRFIGRGRSVHAPVALASTEPLAGTTGDVLDPCLSLRKTLTLEPGATAALTFVLAGAATREEALAVVERFSDAGSVDAGFEGALDAEAVKRAALAWNDEIDHVDALVAGLAYASPELRAGSDVTTSQEVDGAGDDFTGRPLVVVRVASEAGLRAAEALTTAARGWANADYPVHLVALADGVPAEAIQDALGKNALVCPRLGAETLASAHVYIDDALPDLVSGTAPDTPSAQPPGSSGSPGDVLANLDLKLDNGFGGFVGDGSEYAVRAMPTDGGWHFPPLPWANVIASEDAGFVVTERGAGGMWAANSREYRLTPWFNDPVEDPHGEALYLSNEDGAVWSATPGPCPARTPYAVRHGFGYTVFEHEVDGLRVEVTEFVPREQAARVSRVRITNRGDSARTIRITRYAHLVLGSLTAGSDRHVRTQWDESAGGYLSATGALGNEFSDRIAYVATVGGGALSYTADRDAFLGRHRDASRPAALATGESLGGTTGAGLDPCAAVQVALEIEPGETETVAFVLGSAAGGESATDAVAALRQPGAVDAALAEVTTFWRDLLGVVQVETPAPELDLVANGWLLYQDLACRMWGRSAFYQSGGAYGYRDQLQDSTALLVARPDITRAQIVRHASHQFVEGDVLHWWHPPTSKGIRTKFSDDLHWLPYVIATYLRATGDASVLDEVAPYLTADHLDEGEDERFLFPEDSGTSGTVYEHATRALDRGLAVGAHGLPLMGTGDWNDGMNRVGREGRGESVWMACFLYDILGDWADLCADRGDTDRAERYRQHREHLGARINAEGAGWDGGWFRRAYYDDGTPLGTASGDECQIDALVQAWSVLSGAATEVHAEQALDALERRLVDDEAGLIRLLAPPFDVTPHDPGYIKGYVPGVRENGGQYTHAALWAVRALAQAGRSDRAAPILAALSPASHTATEAKARRYQAEPYVVAADVYGVEPHVGRGGWTWYTGSAGWMYRTVIESVLGFETRGGDAFTLAPCVPSDWDRFTLRFTPPNAGGTTYRIEATRGDALGATVNGEPVDVRDGRLWVPISRAGGKHAVRLTFA